MSEGKHVEVPYYVGAQNDAIYIIAGKPPALNNDYPVHDADRTPIAKVYRIEDAEFICRACNSHYALLQACKSALHDLELANETIVKIAKVHPFVLTPNLLRNAIALTAPESEAAK